MSNQDKNPSDDPQPLGDILRDFPLSYEEMEAANVAEAKRAEDTAMADAENADRVSLENLQERLERQSEGEQFDPEYITEAKRIRHEAAVHLEELQARRRKNGEQV
ncbi:MAG: hypothetical protein JWN38_154 [Candidatus Saccharibacteria bacterium]|nr:hypothetical protein [Candidatus Saccharibacteria bacterium]